MPFHRDYPVRTYQSLIKDLQAREEHARERKPRERKGRGERQPKGDRVVLSGDVWGDVYRALMNYSLDELLDMADREGVDRGEIARLDSKGHVANAIIQARKRRLSETARHGGVA